MIITNEMNSKECYNEDRLMHIDKDKYDEYVISLPRKDLEMALKYAYPEDDMVVSLRGDGLVRWLQGLRVDAKLGRLKETILEDVDFKINKEND